MVRARKEKARIPIVVKPNAGMPEMDEHGQPVYRMTPERFAVSMKELIGLGANLVGGCCGTAPEYIRSLAEAVGLT